MGLEAGTGAERSFHTGAREGESAAGCVTQPHPAPLCSPSPSALACQETPLAGASSARSHGSASSPASHPAPLTRASFLLSPPSQSFVPGASVTTSSEVPTSCHRPGLRHPAQSPTQHGGEVGTCTRAQATSPRAFLPAAPRVPHWQILGHARQHPAPQMPALTLAPPQAAQDYGLEARLVKVSGPNRAPCHKRTRVAPLLCDH